LKERSADAVARPCKDVDAEASKKRCPPNRGPTACGMARLRYVLTRSSFEATAALAGLGVATTEVTACDCQQVQLQSLKVGFLAVAMCALVSFAFTRVLRLSRQCPQSRAAATAVAD